MQAPGADEIAQRAAGARAVAGVSLDVALGKIADSLTRREARDQRLYQLLHLVPVQVAVPASGTIDYPDMLGPHDGYRWDVRRLAASGFTAGTVTVYRGSTDGAVIAQWTAPGEWTWSGGLWLAARERLAFVAAGITGNVQVDGTAVEVSEQLLPDYLL